MIDFTKIKKLTIGGVELKQLFINGIQVWKEAPAYTNLVSTAIDRSGNILDGKGYQTGYYVTSGGPFAANAACTLIGLIAIDGSIKHDIYLYGINLTGTARNAYVVYGSDYNGLNSESGLKEGITGRAMLDSIEKLGDYYYKITTKTYSTKVKYFALSGVTVSGLTPIVTMDEPIM